MSFLVGRPGTESDCGDAEWSRWTLLNCNRNVRS